MPLLCAGMKACGWTIGAPKKLSSVASAYVRRSITRADGMSRLLAEQNRERLFQNVSSPSHDAAIRDALYSLSPSPW